MNTVIVIAIVLIVLYNIARYLGKNGNTYSKDQNTKNFNIDSLLKRANEKMITKDFKGAIAITDKVLLLQPDNYDALVCRANSLEALNFNLDAIEDYERAISLDSSDGNILGLLGLTYRKIGDIESGQKYLKLSIDKGTKLYEMNYNMLLTASDIMKQAYVRRGNIPENYQRRNPHDFVDNLTQVDRDEFKQAVRDNLHSLETALAQDPENKHLKDLFEFAKELGN